MLAIVSEQSIRRYTRCHYQAESLHRPQTGIIAPELSLRQAATRRYDDGTLEVSKVQRLASFSQEIRLR